MNWTDIEPIPQVLIDFSDPDLLVTTWSQFSYFCLLLGLCCIVAGAVAGWYLHERQNTE